MNRISLVIVLLVALLALLIPTVPVEAAKEPRASTIFHIRGGPRAKYQAQSGYSPIQITHAYGIDSLSVTGTGQTIAIIDAYGSPTVANDLRVFCSQFNLPQASLTIATPQGTPTTNGGWALETSLDVEWAHALAPGAPILLVEARSNSFSDLFDAIDYATIHGAKVVSMSWGAGDFAGESAYDYHFNHAGVVYCASSGDSGAGVIYPSASPYVLAVGGTSLPLDGSGNLTGPETAWNGSGGGVSSNEAEPSYQASYLTLNTNGKRAVPDVAFDADPYTGVAVYDSTIYSGSTGWWIVGGTSLSSPCWAGIIGLADQLAGTALSNNNLSSSPLYNAANSAVYASNYRDITSGSNGYSTVQGYDLVTGLGSPLAIKLVPYLANPVSTPDFSLGVSPASQTVVQGSGTNYSVTVSSSGGFSGSVSLSVIGLPNGATGTFTTNPTTSASSLAVTTSTSTPAGTYSLIITGKTGSTAHTTTATLVVTGIVPSLSVKVATNNSSYKKGSPVIVTVTVTSSGRPVNRSSVGLTIISPSGSRVSNQSGSTNLSGVVNFTYQISWFAATGVYTVQATASANGFTSGSGSIKFSVN